VAAGATSDEVQRVADRMVQEKAVRLDRAEMILKEIREEKR